MRIKYLFFVLLIALNIVGCDMTKNLEGKLEKRVNKLYTHLQNREFEQVWEMGFKEGWETDFERMQETDFEQMREMGIEAEGRPPKDVFVEMAKAMQSFRIISFNIESMKIDGNKAKVRIKMVTEEKGQVDTDYFHYDYWVYKNGDWFLEDFARTE